MKIKVLFILGCILTQMGLSQTYDKVVKDQIVLIKKFYKEENYDKALLYYDDVVDFTKDNGKVSPGLKKEFLVWGNKITQAEDGFFSIAKGGVKYDVVLVDGGIFTMGCKSEQGSDCEGDEKPVHKVELSS